LNAETIALLARFAIEFGLPAARKLIDLFEKKDATIADVRAAFAAAHTSYDDYEALPAGSPVSPLPPA
jgi:hypothetical protein